MARIFQSKSVFEFASTALVNFLITILAANIAFILSMYNIGYIDTLQKGSPDPYWYQDLFDQVEREGGTWMWIVFIAAFNLFIAAPFSLLGIVLFKTTLTLLGIGTLYTVFWIFNA